MKRISIIILCCLIQLVPLSAQRKMENLDRGLVAVEVTEGVFVSWRMFGTEWYNVTYNLYRDGAKINATPLEVSNYSDAEGTLSSSYSVAAVVDGVEQVQSDAVLPWSKQYLEISMVPRPTGYEVNDATAADLDGDGEYEIIVKRMFNDWTAEATNFTYFEAYKMDGTLIWDINVGPNIMSSSGVEINIAAFDLDEDGKAEVFLRTSEGTIFGDSAQIGDTNGDGTTNYRYSVTQSANMQYMCAGPEFLSLVDGETGVELDRVDFIPRVSPEWWGDNYGHRANKFFFGAPYLDGKHPSLFIGRGIYTKTIMRTYDVVGKKLVQRWEFRATESSDPYFGQGNHNYTIADVDMDGRDEIAWGSMTVDDDGNGLYSTRMGHGDAMHVGDLDPFRKGTEIWKCLENSPMYGTILYDGATGEILIHDVLGRDAGRSCAANISDNIKGKALWGSTQVFSATTKQPVNTETGAVNFRIYWDGDLLEEVLDHNWNGSGGEGSIRKPNVGEILRASGTNSCNWTKGTPSLQADLFGDWREEVIWRTIDNSKIRIYTTINPTPYRNYTLMHDHQYRQAICWQMCGYNQPPHVSYFLGKGEGITVPPPPIITNERLVYNGTGTWDKTTSVWLKDGVSSMYSDGEHVHFDVLNGEDVTVTLNDTVSPSNLTVNSPGNYTLDASAGKLTGTMNLIKQGVGTLSMNGTHDFSGITEIWTGRLEFTDTLSNSPVWVNLFGELSAGGQLGKGVVMRYGSNLYVGGSDEFANLEINDSLSLEEKAELIFDLHSATDTQNDTLRVNGNLVLSDGSIIRIIPHLIGEEERLAPGEYVLAIVSGTIDCDIDKIELEGISGTPADLNIQTDSLVLVVKEMRKPTSVVWNGANSNIWDLVNTANFLNNNIEDVFVTGDTVTIDDDAVSKNIQITQDVNPSSIIFDNSADFTLSGAGAIAGDASLIKNGSGTLTISNNNTFAGKLTLNEGTLQVSALPNNLSEVSPIGPVTNNSGLFVINGGELSVTAETVMDRAMSIGTNGGTINSNQKIDWNGYIAGDTLTKTGAGELVLSSNNSNKNLTIEAGTVRLLDEDAQPGKSVTFKGGTLSCYNNTGTYSSATYALNVPEGKSGSMYLDGRCSYNNTLTGSGTLSIYIPFVRSDLNGNWSNFEGTINISSSSGDEMPCRFNNSYGYPKATLNMANNIYAEHLSGGTVKIGALTGYGKMGNATWEVGAKNEDFAYRGVFTAGNINKVGTGTMILMGSSTTGGTVNVSEGTIFAMNLSGSATGTGIVYVKSGAFLGGTGTISGSILVQYGGTLYGGYPENLGSSLKAKDVTMYTGSTYHVNTNAQNTSSDKILASGKFIANGRLVLDNKSTEQYKDGQKYFIISCQDITGTFDEIIPETPGDSLLWDTTELRTTGFIKVKKVPVSGIDNYRFEKLSIHPNPTDGYVYIDLPKSSGKATIQLVNSNGEILRQEFYEDMARVKLDLSGYNAGVYMIRAICDDRIIVDKLILK